MKRFAGALLLVAFAGGAMACPDGAQQAQAGTIAGKLAEAQQMSPAPAKPAAEAPKAAAKAPAPTPTPTTAVAESAKKAPGG